MLAKKLVLAVAAGAALVATSAFADGRHERWEHERWEHRHHWHPYVAVRPAPVVVAPYYAPPPVYVAPAPAYYRPAPAYYPAPVYAEPSVSVRFRLPL